MPPTGGRTGNRNTKLTQRLANWTDADGTGIAFDSSTEFSLPNGGDRSPDASWVRLERWEALTAEEQDGFPHERSFPPALVAREGSGPTS